MTGVIEQAMLDFAELQGSEIEAKGPGHVTKACLGRCWDRDKVFMRRLAPQFFELSLELGSSYISWLESEVSKLSDVDGGADVLQRGPVLHSDMKYSLVRFHQQWQSVR